MAEYLRASALGDRPGGAAGSTAATPDLWWDTLPTSRRQQVHRWLTEKGNWPEGPVPGQLHLDGQRDAP